MFNIVLKPPTFLKRAGWLRRLIVAAGIEISSSDRSAGQHPATLGILLLEGLNKTYMCCEVQNIWKDPFYLAYKPWSAVTLIHIFAKIVKSIRLAYTHCPQ